MPGHCQNARNLTFFVAVVVVEATMSDGLQDIICQHVRVLLVVAVMLERCIILEHCCIAHLLGLNALSFLVGVNGSECIVVSRGSEWE